MASGLATRFGSNKLLAKLINKTLIEHTLTIITSAGIEHVLVVTRSPEVRALVQLLGFKALLHQLPYQSDTVALGVQHYLDSNLSLQGLLFITGDQPLLKPTTLSKLCAHYLESYHANPTRQIARLGKKKADKILPGNPVIFSPELFSELLTLPQDKGGSVLCKKYPELVQIQLAAPEELLDIDTPEDLERAKANLTKNE